MYPILLFASLMVFVVVTIAYMRQRFSSIYHPITIYLLFHGLVFAIRPIFAYVYGYDFVYRVYNFSPTEDVKTTVIVCANLGLLAFVAGAWKSGDEPLFFRQGPAELAHRQRLVSPFLLAAAIVAPIAVVSIITVYSGGYAGLRLDAATGTAINTTSSGWLYESQQMLVPLSVLIAWTFRFRWWSLIPLLLFVTVRAGTGGRGPFIVACAAAALLWLFDRRQRWPTVRMFALALPLLAIFYVVGQERSFVKSMINGHIVEVQEDTTFMGSMDFANQEFFEFIVQTVPEKTGTYGYFVDSLQVFTEPIPRQLWKNKPVGAPIKMFNLFEHGYPIGLTYSLPGHGWAQAGYFGVVFWCALWGWTLGWVYSRFARGSQGNFEVAAYFAFLPLFIIAFRDGGLVTVFRNGLFYLAPVVAWVLAARALGIPSPQDLARRAGSRRRASAASPPSPPRRRQPAQPQIVPRAWRGRGGPQAAE